jgi:serine/threonine protein kinase
MWAVGCLFAEVFNGMPLFAGESDIHTLSCILCGLGNNMTKRQKIAYFNNSLFEGIKMPHAKEFDLIEQRLEDMGTTALDLLLSILKVPSEDRISAAAALNHSYFRKFSEKFDNEL